MNHTAEIKTDGRYSNTAWNDIDIDKKYRMAVTITTSKESVELLPQLPTQLFS